MFQTDWRCLRKASGIHSSLGSFPFSGKCRYRARKPIGFVRLRKKEVIIEVLEGIGSVVGLLVESSA